MCYFVGMNLTREELHKRFGSEVPVDFRWEPLPFLSGFTFPEIPVITGEKPGEFTPAHWGLIPFWVQDEEKAMELRTHTLNAQSETAAQKPSFRKAFKTGRCLVPASGYFEWHHKGKLKYPFYISRADGLPFAMAGISDSWLNKETGELVLSFSVLTVPANQLLSRVHNTKKRMPLILHPEDEKHWIDPKTDSHLLQSLLMPFPEESLVAHPVARINPGQPSGTYTESVSAPVEYPDLVW